MSVLTTKEAELTAAIQSQSVANTEQTSTVRANTAAIEQEIGIIENLKIVIAQLKAERLQIVDPAALSRQNALIQEAEADLVRAGNAGKVGFDAVGNKIESANKSGNNFMKTLKGIAVFTGFAFLISKIFQVTNAIIDLTEKSEGVQSAFDRINSPDLLSNLRAATKGTVSDLLLMQKAVLASSEGFPVDKLATFYQFALVKSRELGQSTDQVLSKLIDGTLKNSTRVFTSLGLSKAELENSFKKTGDFTGSVLQLIQEQLKKTSSEADNTADKLGRIRATIDDIEANVGKSSTGIIGFVTNLIQRQLDLLNAGIQDLDDKLANLGKKFAVQDNSKLIADFKNDTPEGRASAIKGYEMLIDKQTKAVATYDQKIADVQNNLSLLQRIGRSAFTDLNTKLENDRNSQVVLLAEYKAELQSLNGVVDEENRQKEQQRLKDDASAKARLEALKREQSAAKTLANEVLSTQQKIDQLRDKFTNKGLGKDDAEKAAIVDQFKEYRNQIDKTNRAYDDFVKKFGKGAVASFNANPANKNRKISRVDPGQLDSIQQSAIDDLTAKQTVEKTKIVTDQQKELFKSYEDFKLKYGADAADKAYSADLKGYSSYIDYLEAQLLDLEDSGNATAVAMREFYDKKIQEARADQIVSNAKLLTQYIADAVNFEDKLTNIIKQANDKAYVLRQAANKAQTEQLKDYYNKQADLAEAQGETEVEAKMLQNQQEIESYKDLSTSIMNLSKSQAELRIKQARNVADADMESGKISESAYERIIKMIDQASASVARNTIAQGLGSLSSFFRNLENQLANLILACKVLLKLSQTSYQTLNNLLKELAV